MDLSRVELWASVAALCVVGLIFLASEEVRQDMRASKPYRWGDKPRRSVECWATHGRCAAATIAGLALFLGTIAPH